MSQETAAVLLVDDDAAVAKVLAALLGQEDIEMRRCLDPATKRCAPSTLDLSRSW